MVSHRAKDRRNQKIPAHKRECGGVPEIHGFTLQTRWPSWSPSAVPVPMSFRAGRSRTLARTSGIRATSGSRVSARRIAPISFFHGGSSGNAFDSDLSRPAPLIREGSQPTLVRIRSMVKAASLSLEGGDRRSRSNFREWAVLKSLELPHPNNSLSFAFVPSGGHEASGTSCRSGKDGRRLSRRHAGALAERSLPALKTDARRFLSRNFYLDFHV
jgi:hypothetical protein